MAQTTTYSDIYNKSGDATNLPEMPEPIVQLINSLDQPDISFHQLERIVIASPALSAAVIRTVCSASYAVGKNASESVMSALKTIGMKELERLAIAEWVWPRDAFTWALLLSTGLWGGLGHYIFILAYRHAPATTLAPFIYFGLITHTALGYLVFGQLPDGWTIAGAAIVIASGIYLVHREHVTAMERRKAEEAAKTSS